MQTAKPTTYTVPAVPGSKRTSHRPYTHAVVGRRDGRCSAIIYAADLDANERRYRTWDGKHWDDWKRASEATAGQLYRNHNGFMVEAQQSVIDIGARFIGENPDRAAYIEAKAAERQECLRQMQGSQPGELAVLQWSMSHQNAMRSLTTHMRHHSDVRVVECVPVTK